MRRAFQGGFEVARSKGRSSVSKLAFGRVVQHVLEQAALQIMRTKSPKAAEAFLTAYALECTTQVGSAYAALVDDLMYRFLVGAPELGRSAPPRSAAPAVPDTERRQ